MNRMRAQKTATASLRSTIRQDSPERVQIRGRSLLLGGRKFVVRGVTYGPFDSQTSGSEYLTSVAVQRDFAQMAMRGFNCVRTYTVPPLWLLNIAKQFDLKVFVGLAWPQHVTFLDDSAVVEQITENVAAVIRECAGHPAILGYAIGNDIPASILRWHGVSRTQRFLRRLYQAAKAEDPQAFFTYVDSPGPEHLHLPFLDFACFNIDLDSHELPAEYLLHLLNLAGDRPLLIGEIGVDSRQNGEFTQSRWLEAQIRTISAAGCAGTFVFAWTDESHRSGPSIEDRDFGLTRRDRSPKMALAAATKAFAYDVAQTIQEWPRFSVIVCTHNGERYLPDCLSALGQLLYPNFEVIVVDDGSSDATSDIVSAYRVRLIRSEGDGLSAARNTGLRAATGDFVAFIDDDAFPDPEWLKRLALAFMNGRYAGVGGPNMLPPDDSLIAQCVAHAPGGSTHVLLSDQEAEKIPGCNMAFRRAHLMAIGGFDAQFRRAGDDVDLCWRVQEHGWKLGFCPTATVFHHQRDSFGAYWRQQIADGKADGLLERKWPEKFFNAPRRLTVAGPTDNSARLIRALPLRPEWYLLVGLLAVLSFIGLFWQPLRVTIPLLICVASLSFLLAAVNARNIVSSETASDSRIWWQAFAIVLVLHLMQPVARLFGRLSEELHSWRRAGLPPLRSLQNTMISFWSESGRSVEQWLTDFQSRLRAAGMFSATGNASDDWDLEIRGGRLAAVRTRMVVEEHRGGQILKFQLWPRCSVAAVVTVGLLACLALTAAYDGSWIAACLLLSISAVAAIRVLSDWAFATNALVGTVDDFRTPCAKQETTIAASGNAAATRTAARHP